MSTRVLAAVIERDQETLICRRPNHKRHGGLWEFPGGKVEPGESDFLAVERELEEELKLVVTWVGEVGFSIADPGSEFIIEFIAVQVAGDPQCLEHSELAWVSDEELLDYDLAPSDRKFAEYRLREQKHLPQEPEQ